MQRREHEFQLRADDMSNVVLAHELKVTVPAGALAGFLALQSTVASFDLSCEHLSILPQLLPWTFLGEATEQRAAGSERSWSTGHRESEEGRGRAHRVGEEATGPCPGVPESGGREGCSVRGFSRALWPSGLEPGGPAFLAMPALRFGLFCNCSLLIQFLFRIKDLEEKLHSVQLASKRAEDTVRRK